MKKFLLFVFVLVVFLAVGIYLSLGRIIKVGIENVVPMVTKTKASVEAVNISLLSGEVVIKNLKIANPQGFTSPDVFNLGEIMVVVDMKSLNQKTIVVKKVKIDKVLAAYEIKDGTTNIAVIQNNINSFLGVPKENGETETKKVEPKTTTDEKKLIIEDLSFTNSKLQAVVGGNQINIPVPDIYLKDIGKNDNKTLAEVFAEIMNSFSTQSVKAFANSTADLLKGAGETLKLKTDDLKESIKGLFK